MGFREAGRMRSVGRKHGRWLDTVYLQVALGEGDTTPPPNVP
jgi:phosphinothricin acetyltransferase